MSILKYLTLDSQSGISLKTQLRQQIAWLIVSEKIKAGEKLPPARQMAAYLGINYHTVRSAYHRMQEDGLVQTRQGIGTTVLPQEIGGFISQATKMPSFTIGVLIGGWNPFYSSYLQALQDASRQEPTLFFVCNTQDDPVITGRYIKQLIAKNVDGILLTGADYIFQGEEPQTEIETSVLPIVSVDMPTRRRFQVLLDGFGGGYKATKHLLEHSHDRVGLITCPLVWPNVNKVFQGYLQALQEEQISVEEEYIVTTHEFTKQAGYEAMHMMLDKPDYPRAMFINDGLLALGGLQAIKARGLRVPEDIALTTYIDFIFSSEVDPPLTTADVSSYEVGIQAFTMLQALIRGQTINENVVVVGSKLIIRRSCGCQAG